MHWHFGLSETPTKPLFEHDQVHIIYMGNELVWARAVKLSWVVEKHQLFDKPETWIWNLGFDSMASMPASIAGCKTGGAFTTLKSGASIPKFAAPMLTNLVLIKEMTYIDWTLNAHPAMKRNDKWPDKCDRCGSFAWIGPYQISCQAKCCRERS